MSKNNKKGEKLVVSTGAGDLIEMTWQELDEEGEELGYGPYDGGRYAPDGVSVVYKSWEEYEAAQR